MKISEYAALRGEYPMPEDADCGGGAADNERGWVLFIGAVTRRETWNRLGYVCHKDAEPEFHACVCSLLRMAKDMPVIKTVLLKPEDVCAPVCGEYKPTKTMLLASALAVAALREALKDHILHNANSVQSV